MTTTCSAYQSICNHYQHLKDKLGSGGAVKGADIEIQGDQRERLVALLNELGYRAKQG